MAKKTTSKTRTDSGPDYPFWVAMPTWTREEAIALLSGQNPDIPTEDITSSDVQKKIARLLERAFESGAFPNAIRVSPEDCLSAMESFGLSAPKALSAAASANEISIMNWRAECERKEAEIERLRRNIETEATIEKRATSKLNVTGLKKKIGSLQIALLGLSIAKFNLKRDWNNSSSATNIANAIHQSGLSLDKDTIRTHLAEAIEAVGDRAKFHGED